MSSSLVITCSMSSSYGITFWGYRKGSRTNSNYEFVGIKHIKCYFPWKICLWYNSIATSFSSFLFFLQFWTRCPNPLQLLQSFVFLLSNFTFSLARVHFSLSRLLNKVLYCSWDIIVKFQDGYRVNDLILLLLRLLGHKIFTQPDTYCPTDYCPNDMVILSP